MVKNGSIVCCLLTQYSLFAAIVRCKAVCTCRFTCTNDVLLRIDIYYFSFRHSARKIDLVLQHTL